MKVTKYTKFISLVLVVLLLFSIAPIPPNVFAETDTTTNSNEIDITTTLDNQNQSQDNISTSDDSESNSNETDTTTKDSVNTSDNSEYNSNETDETDTTSQIIDTSSSTHNEDTNTIININISQLNLAEDVAKVDFSKYFNIAMLQNNVDDILTASFYNSYNINEDSTTSIDTTSYEANAYYYITISPKENLSDEDNDIATNIIIQNKYLQHEDNTNKFYKNETGSIDTTTFNVEFEYVNTLDTTNNNIIPTHPTGHLRITQTRPELTRYAIYPLYTNKPGSRLTFNVSEMSGSPLEKTVELISRMRYVVAGYANVFGEEKKVVYGLVDIKTNTTKDFTLDNEMNQEYPLNYGRLNVKFADNDVNTQHLRIALYKDDTFLGIEDYNDGAHFQNIPFDTNYTIKAYDYDDENDKLYEIGDVGNVDINNVFELQWPDVADNVFTVPNGNYTHRSSVTTSYSGNRVLHIEVCKWKQSYYNPWNYSVADLYYNSATDTNIHNATNLLPGRYKVKIYATEDSSSRHPIYTTDEFEFNEVGSTMHIDIDSLNIEDRIANYVDPDYTKIHMPFNQPTKQVQIVLKEKQYGSIVDTLTNTKQMSKILDKDKNYIAEIGIVNPNDGITTIVQHKYIDYSNLTAGKVSTIDGLDDFLSKFNDVVDETDKYVEFYIYRASDEYHLFGADENAKLFLLKDLTFNVYEYDENLPKPYAGAIVNDNTGSPIEIKHTTEDEVEAYYKPNVAGVKVYGLEVGKKYVLLPKDMLTHQDIMSQYGYYSMYHEESKPIYDIVTIDSYKDKHPMFFMYKVPTINNVEIVDFDKDTATMTVNIEGTPLNKYGFAFVHLLPYNKHTQEPLVKPDYAPYEDESITFPIYITNNKITQTVRFVKPDVVAQIQNGTLTLDDMSFKVRFLVGQPEDHMFLINVLADVNNVEQNIIPSTSNITIKLLDKSSNLPIPGVNLLLLYLLGDGNDNYKLVPINETTNGIDHIIKSSHEIITSTDADGVTIDNIDRAYFLFKQLAPPNNIWKVIKLIALQKDMLDGYLKLDNKFIGDYMSNPSDVLDQYKYMHPINLNSPFGNDLILYNEPRVGIVSAPSYDTATNATDVLIDVSTDLSKLVKNTDYTVEWYLYEAVPNSNQFLGSNPFSSQHRKHFPASGTTATISVNQDGKHHISIPKTIWSTINQYRLVTIVSRNNHYGMPQEVGRLDETHTINNNTTTSNLSIELKDLSSKQHISGIKLLPLIKPIANFSADDIISVSALGGAPLHNNLTGDDDMEYTDNNVILSKDAPVQFEIASKYNNTITDNLIKVYQDKIPDGYIDQTFLTYLPDNRFQRYNGTYMGYGDDIVNNNRTITIYNEPYVTINTTKDNPIYGSTNATITIDTTLDKLVPNYYYRVKIELKTPDETITLATKDDIEFVATGTTKTIEDNTFTIPIQSLVNLQNYKLIHTVERSTTNPPALFGVVGTLKEDVALQSPQPPVYGKPVKVRVINYDYIQNTGGINIQYNYQNMSNISFDIYKGNPTDVNNGNHEKVAENITTNSDGTFILENILTANNVYYLVGRENDIIENSIDKDVTSIVKPFIFDVNINKDTKNTTILNVDIEGIVTDKNNTPLNTISNELIIPVYKNPNLDSNKINHTDTKVTMRVDIDVPKDVILNKYDVFKLSTDITQNNNATQSNDIPINIDKNTVRLYLNNRKVSNGGIKNIISDNNNSFEVMLQPGRLEAARSRYVGAVARPVGYNISNRNIVDMTGTFRLSLEYDVIIDKNKLADVPLNYNATTTLSFKKIDNVARSISKTVPFELPKKSSGSTPPPPTVPGPITPKPVPPTPHTPTDPYTPYKPKDKPKDVPKDTPKDNPKDDGPKDEPKEVPNDTPNDVPTDSPKDIPIDDTPDDKDIPTDETVPELINSGSSTNYTYLIYALIGFVVMIVGSVTIIHKKRK